MANCQDPLAAWLSHRRTPHPVEHHSQLELTKYRLSHRIHLLLAQGTNGSGNGATAGGNGSSPAPDADGELPALSEQWNPMSPYKVRVDMVNLLSPELQ